MSVVVVVDGDQDDARGRGRGSAGPGRGDRRRREDAGRDPERVVPGRGVPAHRGTWAVSWRGLRTVTTLEVRRRAGRAAAVLLAVGLVATVAAVTVTFRAARLSSGPGALLTLDPLRRSALQLGPVLAGPVLLVALTLGLLAAPVLTARPLAGDRADGTLARLQTSLLTPAEIVLGKVAAAWLATLALLVGALPGLVLAALAGGVGLGSLTRAALVVALLLGAACAVGTAASAITPRPALAAALALLAALTLAAGGVAAYRATLPLVRGEGTVRVYEDTFFPPQRLATDSGHCTWHTAVEPVVRTERTWWLAALSPVVVAADAAPARAAGPAWLARSAVPDPVAELRGDVRAARAGSGERDACSDRHRLPGYVSPVGPGAPVWPWGLGANLALGAGAGALAVRRVRVPR